MHTIAGKNKYVGMLFMKMSQEYFSLGKSGMAKISVPHADELRKYNPALTHYVTTGLDARFDQVTMIEADTLEEIHNAAADFRMGAKGAYIEIVNVVVGIKAPPRPPGSPK